MTNSQFHKGINSELREAGFISRLTKVTETGVNTTLVFDCMETPLTVAALEWLNKRFTHGIHVDEDQPGLVFINTPKDAERMAAQELADLPGLKMTPLRTMEVPAVKVIKKNNYLFAITDSKQPEHPVTFILQMVTAFDAYLYLIKCKRMFELLGIPVISRSYCFTVTFSDGGTLTYQMKPGA